MEEIEAVVVRALRRCGPSVMVNEPRIIGALRAELGPVVVGGEKDRSPQRAGMAEHASDK